MNRGAVITGACLAMLAVMLGAFAAHGLKAVLDAYSLGLVETAARYQMYHAIALIIVGVMSTTRQFSPLWLRLAAIAFILGILLFSGSLYGLALTGSKWLGAITPVGGVALILGWCALIGTALAQPSRDSRPHQDK